MIKQLIKRAGANKAVVLLFFFAVALSACEGEVGKKVMKTGVYYDLKGLLDHHLYLLDSLQPSVSKITEIDGNRETKTVKLDSTGWAKEMEIFYQADINEPVLRDAYITDEGAMEDSLKVITFKAKDKKGTKIDYLSIFYKEEKDSPTYVTALFKESNALYESERTLKLSFDNSRIPPVLKGYTIKGIQNMLMKDTVSYKVEAEIIF